MLTRRGLSRSRRARVLAAPLTLLAAGAAVLLPAGPAWADHVRDQQLWVLDAVHAPAAWQTTRGHGVTVAVIDSGVSPGVSDLAGSVTVGPDLTGVSTPMTNPNWGTHGTWMAALIAGHGHGVGGASGITGVAPEARILSVRVVTDTGDPGYQRYQREPDDQVQQALATAIRDAVRHGAAVISMSLGYGAPSLPVRSALQFALSHGTVVVASAGNSGGQAAAHRDGQAPYSFPADYPGVLGVGAVSQSGSSASFSSANLSVQVAAPGVMVPTQGRDGKYWYVNGTSPACALTAGVAALIKSEFPTLPPALVDQAITGSTQDRPHGGYNDQVGFGTVDAAAALTVAHRLARSHGLAGAAGGGSAGQPGIAAAAQFGGGPAANPAPPVRPRSGARLVVYSVLALAFAGGVAGAALWLARMRRARRSAAGRAGGWQVPQQLPPRAVQPGMVPAQPGEGGWPGGAALPGGGYGYGAGAWPPPAGWPAAGPGPGAGPLPAAWPGAGPHGAPGPLAANGAGGPAGGGHWPGNGHLPAGENGFTGGYGPAGASGQPGLPGPAAEGRPGGYGHAGHPQPGGNGAAGYGPAEGRPGDGGPGGYGPAGYGSAGGHGAAGYGSAGGYGAAGGDGSAGYGIAGGYGAAGGDGSGAGRPAGEGAGRGPGAGGWPAAGTGPDSGPDDDTWPGASPGYGPGPQEPPWPGRGR
ncbi:MAG: S8 family peptidase [Gemmatimonadota bacterium]